MVCPTVLKGTRGPRFFFNLDGKVGPRCPNRLDDVQLVQFGYYAMARSVNALPDEQPVFMRVTPGAMYTGAPDDPLTLAIKLHQAHRGGTQDGCVSALHLGQAPSYDGAHSFMLIPLQNNIRDMMPADYPRLDKHSACPPALRAAVQLCFIG